MVTTTDAPIVPNNPKINLSTNFNLPGLVSESVSDITWNSISITSPTEPTFDFPDVPSNIDPVEPIKPVLKNLDIPEVEYFKVLQDPPQAPRVTDINVPSRVELELWTGLVPQFSKKVPVNNVAWNYEDFTTEFRDILTNLFANFERPEHVKGSFQFLNQEILKDEIDLLEERGNDNQFKDTLERNLLLLEGDFLSFQEIVDHELLNKYKASEIELRQDNERILRGQYKERKTLEFQFADKVSQIWVQNYNACINEYNAQVNYYAGLAQDYQSKLQGNLIRLQKMETELKIANDIKGYNAELVAVFQAEAESHASLINLFKSQMTVAKRLLALELISLELFQVEIEAFTASVRALEGKAREAQVLASAEADIAETDIAPALLEELNAKVTTAEAELDVEKVKFDSARKIYLAKETAVNAEIRTFQNGLGSQSALLQAQVELSKERSELDRVNRIYSARSDEDRRIVDFQDQESFNKINRAKEGTSDGFSGFLGTLEKRRDEILAGDRAFNILVNSAELDSVKKFSQAKITNALTHVINNG